MVPILSREREIDRGRVSLSDVYVSTSLTRFYEASTRGL